MNRISSTAVIVTMTLLSVFSAEPGAAAEQERVQAAIQDGIESLRRRIRKLDVISYRTKKNGPLRQVTGTVKRNRGGMVQIETADGRKVSVKRRLIQTWDRAGLVHPEMRNIAQGGPSALVAFALLSAGVPPSDPDLKLLLGALAESDAKKAGTYVRSLRATVWSKLLETAVKKTEKRKYTRLLRKDMNWLMAAMTGRGDYGYTQSGGTGDNSNTQFANLGLWAGAIAKVEVANKYWQRIAKFWIKAQQPGGGWTYRTTSRNATPSMTVAGCNSLYIVLDRYYSKADSAYKLFRGAAPNKKIRKEIARIFRAVGDGDRYLALNPPDVTQSYGYELFGLERLGLASGQAQIGDVDWFREHVGAVSRVEWGRSAIADAFALIFLVHGEAPILFQKLEHGDEADNWNYYFRDLSSLTRHLSHTFERLYRWQRIPTDATLRSLQDAPFLVISGHNVLSLPEATLGRLREYINSGGTVFLHADLASKRFQRSAKRVFENLFAERDLRFRELEPSHDLYRCHFGGGENAWKKHVPFSALTDGPRIMVLMSTSDIAGAWHQDLGRFRDLFNIMANLRMYAAPEYDRLPRVLRPEPKKKRKATRLGSLSVRRFGYAGEWAAHAGVWERQRSGILHRTGVSLDIDERGQAELTGADVVHLTTRGTANLNRETLDSLKNYIKDGGFLLIDSADGQGRGNKAVRDLVRLIDVGERGRLGADHPLAAGEFPGGESLLDLETTKFATSLGRAGAPPPILTRTIDGRLAVVACPFDLVAGMDGHYIWKRVGYLPEDTRMLVDNVLLWRFNEQKRGHR